MKNTNQEKQGSSRSKKIGLIWMGIGVSGLVLGFSLLLMTGFENITRFDLTIISFVALIPCSVLFFLGLKIFRQ